MNRSMIRYMIGRVFCVFGFVMMAPLLVSLYYAEPLRITMSWMIIISLLFLLGLALSLKRPHEYHFYAKEGMVICALLWFLLSFLGAMPLFISGDFPNLVDAFFEITSGLTTTGSSVHSHVEMLSQSVLFWRSLSHWIGGMGVLVFALALIPKSSVDSQHVMKAEVPGPTFGKITAKLSDTARILYLIYFVLTALTILFLLFGGMPLFDSFCHAFGAAGTGGFGIKGASIGYYESSYIHMVLSIAMLVFGVNFSLYYLILLRRFRDFFRDEELHWYLGIIAVATILIMINLWPSYNSVWYLFRDSFFTVTSIITTTGYSTADFSTWPLFSHVILLILMFIGGCAGSTAGGIKVSRVAIGLKAHRAEFLRQFSPNRVVSVSFNHTPVPKKFFRSLQGYLSAYVLIFCCILLITALDSPNFSTAFSAVSATFNNIGPGLGSVAPSASFASFNNVTKLALSFGMIAGRLEIWPVLILFSPKTWRHL